MFQKKQNLPSLNAPLTIAMFTRNRIELTGHIAKQAETRAIGDTTVTRARLLHNESIPRPEGDPIEKLVAIDLEIWGKRGESFANLVTSKSPVHVEGRLQMDQWEQNGQSRSRLLVRVDEWQFLLPKPANATPGAPAAEAKPVPPSSNRRTYAKAASR